MDYKRRINDIRGRAQAIGLPVRVLVQSAGSNYSTFCRWQQDSANPRARTTNDALDAIEDQLALREIELLSELARRWPEHAMRAAAGTQAEGTV